MIKVKILQPINASSIEINEVLVKKKGDTTNIAASAGEILSTDAAKIVANWYDF